MRWARETSLTVIMKQGYQQQAQAESRVLKVLPEEWGDALECLPDRQRKKQEPNES
jgi:hypothetical protein